MKGRLKFIWTCPKGWTAAPHHILCLILLLAFSAISADARGPITLDHTGDDSRYFMAGANGGRGGLPEVKLWFAKSQQSLIRSTNENSMNYPAAPAPKDMHYPGWNFWQFGVSDALLQLISQQATDPNHQIPSLGRYFSKLNHSGITAWSEKPGPAPTLEIDISAGSPVTESVRTDHYITYGLSNSLYFNGDAKWQLTVDRQRHVRAKLLASTLPIKETEKLQKGLEGLKDHPLFSFPENSDKTKEAPQPKFIQLIAEFTIDREPGPLKPAATKRPRHGTKTMH